MLLGITIRGQASLRAYMAPGGFLRFVAYSPLRVGAGSTLELWINVETPSAVSSKTILLDDSTKVSVLDIQEAYQWTNIQIPLDGKS